MKKTRKVRLNGKQYTLGKEYKDTLLGIKGIATAGVAYLTGCDQLQLSFVDNVGCANAHWVDVTNVEAVKPPRKKKLAAKPRRTPGGPAPVIPSRVPVRQPR